jgi:hypothetical protein
MQPHEKALMLIKFGLILIEMWIGKEDTSGMDAFFKQKNTSTLFYLVAFKMNFFYWSVFLPHTTSQSPGLLH